MSRPTSLKVVWLAAVSLLAMVGCDAARSYREVLRDQIIAMRETEQILAGVHDAASMETARSRLQANLEWTEEIQNRAIELPPPNEEIRARLQPEAAQLQEALKGVQAQVRRIRSSVPGGEAFLRSLGPTSAILRD